MFRTNTNIMGQRSTFVVEASATGGLRDEYVFSAERVDKSDKIYHIIDRNPHIKAIRTSNEPQILYGDSNAYVDCIINEQINWRSRKELLLYVEDVRIGHDPTFVRCEGYTEDKVNIGDANEATVIVEGEGTRLNIKYNEGQGWLIDCQEEIQSEKFGINTSVSNNFNKKSELVRLEFSEYDDVNALEVRYPS